MTEDLLLQELLHIGVVAATAAAPVSREVVSTPAIVAQETAVNTPTADVDAQLSQALQFTVQPFLQAMQARLARLTKVHAILGQELLTVASELERFEASLYNLESTAPGGDS